jgi:hypothetical protein
VSIDVLEAPSNHVQPYVHLSVMGWFFDLHLPRKRSRIRRLADMTTNKFTDPLTTIFMSAMDSLDLANGVH